MRQTQQKGSITVRNGSWVLRWREYSEDARGNRNVRRRFRILGDVEQTHRRNMKRVPQHIQDEASKVLEPLNQQTTTSISGTIGELWKEYLKGKLLKPSTLQTYKNYWGHFLEKRIGGIAVSGFRRVDAYNLWSQIHDANRHLSRATMSKVRFLVSGMFEFAKNTGRYFGENPALADLPEGLPGKKETGAYTIEEVNSMLSVLDSALARAIVAAFFASGLRKGEIAGLDWHDYERTTDGAILHVRRSVWQKHVTPPKTESSADVVQIGPSAVEYIEAFKESVGKPTEGYMFGYDAKHPINLSSFARWAIRPVLNRCAECKKPKSQHKKEEHEYRRDDSLPVWKGWHAFRRGNATHLAKNYKGDGVNAASIVLRHSDEGVTQQAYIKNTRQERRVKQAAKAIQKVVQIGETRQQAAVILGAGIRQHSQAVN